SSKNQSASATSSPAQTPRSSIQESRLSQSQPRAHKMTQQEALEKLMRTSMYDAATGPYIR
ncbi:hypothetical protein BG004_005789, partial [Podila humilis]